MVNLVPAVIAMIGGMAIGHFIVTTREMAKYHAAGALTIPVERRFRIHLFAAVVVFVVAFIGVIIT